MKALILAGGAGTRLRPITHTRAKQLVPVANKPILFYGLEAIASAGIKQVGIIVGDTADEVRAAVGDGSAWGLEVTYLPQDAPLGLAHCVLIAKDFLGEDDFVMYLGDNMLRQSLQGFVDTFEAARVAARNPTLGGGASDAPAAQILLKHVPDPHRFGVAELDGLGRVVRLVEKPADPPSDLALVGVYLFDARIHDAVAAISPSPRGELEITDAIQWLIDHGYGVNSDILEGWWIDTGKLTPLLEANRLILETIEQRLDGDVDEESRIDGRVVVEAGARIERSTVRGPAVIGAGTVVRDSFVGPFSAVGANCRIERSEIEHSVLLGETSVVDAGRIEDSLLGYHVSVGRSDQRPRATRLMLGDHCNVDLA
ncbi:glucose-1-phosphate thymidylyltransferase [Acidiferrimicrobium sp. IK]|uniref:glucose-1-phosphate thymidylyltransferase n=1 Tax=Acidiferrimicrobium sp. IK TaxID=2871700 RepID=UPI0021CB0D44|nr:glucose-1-phosphate thymidylyltransferase [Acidiferrimicrobium sp. IK]MCU4185710.1 glucose-1-phosphate thymidylyltransferase [Acidiferrimicrobium sp. IK]